MRVCKAELLSDFHTFADEASSSDLGILVHGQRLVQGMTKMKRTVHPGGTLAIQLANLVNRWHYMHMLEIQPQSGTTCISQKFSHQVAPVALVRNLATRWRHFH